MHPHWPDDQGVETANRWQSVVEEKIAQARERGEFDDLPGTGERMRIRENSLAGDWELAFHVLENAEMAPPWMEMSREVREGRAALDALRQRTARYLAEQAALALAAPPDPAPEMPVSRRWWWPFRAAAPASTPNREPRVTLSALEAERQRARRVYLEQAAQLDEVIAAYNGWLPDNLRRLQKPRLRPATAAAEFDAVCPPVPLNHSQSGRTP